VAQYNVTDFEDEYRRMREQSRMGALGRAQMGLAVAGPAPRPFDSDVYLGRAGNAPAEKTSTNKKLLLLEDVT